MSEVELYHRLYTHAGDAGGRPQKLGDRDAETVLSGAQLTKLDKLMASIIPPPDGRAYAFARFASFACFIVSEATLDGRGRSGARTQARVARLKARTAMLDLPALIDADENDTTLPVAAWSTYNAEEHGREAISNVMAMLLASVPRAESFAAPAVDLRLLANVWPLLPLSLQESITWSLNAEDGARVSVAFGKGGTIPATVKTLARRYVDWVLDRPDDAKRAIETTRATSLRDLEDLLEEAPPMATPKPKPQRGTGTLDPQLVEFLNEQIKASEASIRDWLDDELDSNRDARPVSRPRTPTPPLPVLIAAAAVVLVALATLGFFAWRSEKRIRSLERQIVTLSQATGVPTPPVLEDDEPEEQPADLLKTPDAIPGAGWPERFQWVVENRQQDVSPMIVALARPAQLSQKAERDLQRMADLLARNEILPSADRRLLRGYLYQLVRNEKTIDGKPAEDDAGKQSEVVLRWIAQQR